MTLDEMAEPWAEGGMVADASGAIRVKLVGLAHCSDTRAGESVCLVQLDVYDDEEEGDPR